VAGLFPNPVQGRAQLSFRLEQRSRVSCVVYDAAGKRAAVLLDGTQDQGDHVLSWDASRLSPGVYFCELEAGAASRSVRFVVAR